MLISRYIYKVVTLVTWLQLLFTIFSARTDSFHNRYEDSYSKLKAAYDQGCRRFDSAIKGIGGCPMAKDDLVGNMPTEQVINFMSVEKAEHKLNLLNFESAYNKAKDIFHF